MQRGQRVGVVVAIEQHRKRGREQTVVNLCDQKKKRHVNGLEEEEKHSQTTQL